MSKKDEASLQGHSDKNKGRVIDAATSAHESTPTKPYYPKDESVSPKTKPAKLYQAYVEDYFSSEEEAGPSKPTPVQSKGSHRAASPSRPKVPTVPALKSSNCTFPAYYCSNAGSDSNPEGGESNPPSPRPKKAVHFSDRSPPRIRHNSSSSSSSSGSDFRERQNTSRPRVKPQDLSPVDLKWGRLFNNDWKPEPRLRSVYIGIAEFMLKNFEPQTEVLTREKLRIFFQRFKCPNEVIQFVSIFSAGKAEITKLFERMECDYHLIPSGPGQRPSWPALTCLSFARFMEQCIEADPSNEAARMARVVAQFPIEAEGFGIDGQKESVPREISRHLFPPKKNKMLHDYLNITSLGTQLQRRKGSAPVLNQPANANTQRERSPRDSTPDITLDHAPLSPRQPPPSCTYRDESVFDTSRRYVPQETQFPPTPRRERSSSGPAEETYVYTRRPDSYRPRSPVVIRHRSDASPPRRREPSPPGRRRRGSVSGISSAMVANLFRGESRLHPDHAEDDYRRRRRDSDTRREYHGDSYRRGSRKPEYRYCSDSRNHSRRGSFESTPRGSLDSWSPTASEWKRTGGPTITYEGPRRRVAGER